MLYTLFFSKLRDLPGGEMDEYYERATALRAVAESEHPGFVDMKTYIADDGDRLTVVRFSDAESQRAWRMVPEHREAQARGRMHYYDRFHIVVCEEVRAHRFERSASAVADEPGDSTSQEA